LNVSKPHEHARLKVWLPLLGTALAWASTFHVAKYIVAFMPPIGSAIWRFAIASLFLIPVVTVRERWDWVALRANLGWLVFLGGIGIAGFQLGMFYGLQTSSATNASLIMALSPALTVMFAAMTGGERISAARWLGLAVGLIGVLIVATGGSWQALAALQFGRGDLWLAGGATTWAIYSVVLRRHVRGLGVLQLSASTILISALALTLMAAVASPSQLIAPPNAAWWALLFMGVVGSGFAYLWWNTGVMKLGAARAASFMNLVPVFTMIIGVALGQSLSWAQLLGGALVIAGVVMATQEPAQ
jgi:drug/metabolite transporter (DMT)-like permease